MWGKVCGGVRAAGPAAEPPKRAEPVCPPEAGGLRPAAAPCRGCRKGAKSGTPGRGGSPGLNHTIIANLQRSSKCGKKGLAAGGRECYNREKAGKEPK